MRGARGIEFGVDLPAFPVIGLGSVLPTSITRTLNNTPPTDQGDGWGFRDWKRFVVAWMKSKSESATRDKDMTGTESQGHHRDQEVSLSSSLPHPQPQKHKTPSVKRVRERLSDDEAVRSRTDTLSAVFDWLIERVPAPKRILGVGSTGSEGGVNEAKARNWQSEGKASLTKEPEEVVTNSERPEKQDTNPGRDEKEISALAVTYTVSHGVGSSASTASSTSSETKRRMDSEKADLKKSNELGSKDDLERFYVALTRKMYNEGL
jgi:triacylglycerol lipase